VAEVCQHLDGLPLAIELAAARVQALAVEQIAGRLDDRFRLLTGGSRTSIARQQTLRAAMDWSFGLLTENERTLISRVSVFAGGWTLEAAETVCSDTALHLVVFPPPPRQRHRLFCIRGPFAHCLESPSALVPSAAPPSGAAAVAH